MTPDYERAALAASKTLIKYGISASPVSPLPIFKSLPGVLVISYEDVSNDLGTDRNCMLSMLGEHNKDAFTSVNLVNGKKQYIVTYNQQLSVNLFQRALARELGHIILGHDGSLPESVRNEEAKCFANHLLCPRPLIVNLQRIHLRMTVEVLGNLTGCYDYCLSCMRRLPGVHIPKEINRQIRDNFMPFILNFLDYQRFASLSDGSALADFGTYLDNYEE